ncbi:uncharacterized protein LOC143918917 [Arctopsyche grandis]|uniref:uncharacterized protein LOC143918917 n=1 Tax=Arctopsyche grandis TaxID=121162 RepID=UPI00406D9A0E
MLSSVSCRRPRTHHTSHTTHQHHTTHIFSDHPKKKKKEANHKIQNSKPSTPKQEARARRRPQRAAPKNQIQKTGTLCMEIRRKIIRDYVFMTNNNIVLDFQNRTCSNIAFPMDTKLYDLQMAEKEVVWQRIQLMLYIYPVDPNLFENRRQIRF